MAQAAIDLIAAREQEKEEEEDSYCTKGGWSTIEQSTDRYYLILWSISSLVDRERREEFVEFCFALPDKPFEHKFAIVRSLFFRMYVHVCNNYASIKLVHYSRRFINFIRIIRIRSISSNLFHSSCLDSRICS